GRVVALDELHQFVVPEQRAFAGRYVFTGNRRERAHGLDAVVTHVPLAPCVQAKPAITMGHVRPFGHGGLDDLIHGALLLAHRCFINHWPTASGMARTWPG